MIRALRAFRMSSLQLAAVTSVSLTATVLIVVNATGSTALDTAVVAALARHVVVHRTAAPVPARQPVNNTPSAGNSGATSSAGSSNSGSSGGSAGVGVGANTTTTTTTTATTPSLPHYKVKHLFVIALSTSSYADAFGARSPALYLNGTLRKRGTLLSGYQTLPGASELADELATISGQAPNADTRAGCTAYSEFSAKAKPAKNGQVPGPGCVYPNTTLTIGDQVTSSGKHWGAYIDYMGKAACVHPNSGAADGVALPGAGPLYDTRHNPFIYFHSLLDLGDCASDDKALDRLPAALAKSSHTPEYVYIAPGTCDDASATTCADGKSTPGIAGEDEFLKTWVPKILGSPAYKHDGALVIAFTSGSTAAPSGKATTTGALLISRYVGSDKVVKTTYGPYSLLRTAEDLFSLTPLAHAKTAASFADLFTKGT